MTTVTTPAGLTFQICPRCMHWPKRYVEGCKCCHGDRPEGEE